MQAEHAISFGKEAGARVIDDHPMFCDALELTLGSICEFSKIRSANSIAQAAELIDQNA